MDAFSLSIVNALSEPSMSNGRRCKIAGVYAFFQFAMPMIGWFCVHSIANIFISFQKFIPWIALILLLYIGAKMIIEAAGKKNEYCASCGKDKNECETCKEKSKSKTLTFPLLLMQGIATSIDALSVGFTISTYNHLMALFSSLIIATVTFFICITGLLIGKATAQRLSSRSQTAGGIILIFIGIEIFVRAMF